MTIRRATTADAALLAEINQSVQELHAKGRPDLFKPPTDLEAFTAFYEEVLSLAENHVFIAEVENRAVGHVIAKIVRRPENPFTYALDYLFVDQFGVVEGERGKGYGSMLLEAVCELARAENITEIRLDVWDFNAQARGFYAKRGFTPYNHRLALFLD